MTEKRIQNLLWKFLEKKSHRSIISNFTPTDWWECDMFSVTKAGYGYEFEIKISKADFKADAVKNRVVRGKSWPPTTEVKHELLAKGQPDGPSRFAYVVPEGLLTPEDVPEWSGLYVVYKRRNGHLAIKQEKQSPSLHKQKTPQSTIDKIKDSYMWRYWALRCKVDKQ